MSKLQHRIILFHTQSTSARTRFLFFTSRNSILAFSGLPDLSSLLDDDKCVSEMKSMQGQQNEVLSSYLANNGITATDQVMFDPEFFRLVDAPNATIAISLARFTHVDPPFELAESLGAEFNELTGLRSVREVEMELLQNAYQRIMG